MKGDALAFGEGSELVDRSRTAVVERADQRPVTFATREQRKLDRRGRLARALQAHEHHRGRRLR